MKMSVLPAAAHDQQSDSETLLQPVREALRCSHDQYDDFLVDLHRQITFYTPSLTRSAPKINPFLECQKIFQA